MNRLIVAGVAGGILIAGAGLVLVTAAPNRGPVFIAGDQPVTEIQIREKLQSDGWSNIQIVREGRYFEAIASKEGKSSKITVDSQTGRLRGGDDDDDD